MIFGNFDFDGSKSLSVDFLTMLGNSAEVHHLRVVPKQVAPVAFYDVTLLVSKYTPFQTNGVTKLR
jgi:hypothetical protein